MKFQLSSATHFGFRAFQSFRRSRFLSPPFKWKVWQVSSGMLGQPNVAGFLTAPLSHNSHCSLHSSPIVFQPGTGTILRLSDSNLNKHKMATIAMVMGSWLWCTGARWLIILIHIQTKFSRSVILVKLIRYTFS